MVESIEKEGCGDISFEAKRVLLALAWTSTEAASADELAQPTLTQPHLPPVPAPPKAGGAPAHATSRAAMAQQPTGDDASALAPTPSSLSPSLKEPSPPPKNNVIFVRPADARRPVHWLGDLS